MRVERCFGFVDLCGFTAFTETYGDEHTVAVLANFRATLREIAARRGVRLAKWLGDGAMLAAADPEAVVATVLEVSARGEPQALPLPIRAGLAQGAVIMFEGDDYIGRAPNVASRLCDAALPGQTLATREVSSRVPRWVATTDAHSYTAQGFDRPLEACVLSIGASEATVTDAHCGLVLPEMPGLATRFGPDGTVNRFCSTACASAWEQAQQRPRPITALRSA
ncbi:MAG: adenylate/guanylate cyclase domain-containing protein [Acidimicrobiales bacterium]